VIASTVVITEYDQPRAGCKASARFLGGRRILAFAMSRGHLIPSTFPTFETGMRVTSCQRYDIFELVVERVEDPMAMAGRFRCDTKCDTRSGAVAVGVLLASVPYP
jgi:hypothetical protein